MKRGILNRVGLSLLFSLFVLLILLITNVITGFAAILTFKAGLIAPMERPGFPLPILIFLLASVIVGTAVSFLVGKLPLRPLRKMIAAVNQLAAGDFSVRLSGIKGPPQMRELAESFNRMAAELGSIEMLRSDFVKSFSHEFKTPIGSIKGYAEMLRYAELSQEEQNDYLDTVIRESNRLSTLADNILDLSRVEAQTIVSDKRPFDLTEQVRRCILLLEQKWSKKTLSLSLDLQEVYYTGNDKMLTQVWLNLLDNAIKFTPESGEISITIAEAESHITICLRDSGCGISQKAVSRIFDKFYQADISHATQGNGLGLAIARKIIELHGGAIHCQSELGCGSEFTVTLPKCPK